MSDEILQELAYELGTTTAEMELAAAALEQTELPNPAHHKAYTALALAMTIFAWNDPTLEPETAETFARAALTIDLKDLGASVALNDALIRQFRVTEAVAVCREVVRQRPFDWLWQYNLGMTLLATGADDAEAFTALRKADDLEALLSGPASRRSVAPVWQGEALAGKTLLIYSSGGWGRGDVIWLARYFLELVKRGAHIIYLDSRGLAPLIGQLPGVLGIEDARDIPPHDFQSSIISVPGVLADGASTWIPAGARYLSADPLKSAEWRHRLGTNRPKVGLVWSGNTGYRRNLQRSIPPQHLQRILDVPGVDFVSLQVGPTSGAVQHPNLTSVTDLLVDYGETAAAIEALDLVITVDTSVAHLSGALGKPTWLMLPHVPDTRWGFSGNTSRWYASARLFRQPWPGAWAGVAQAVAEALSATAITTPA